MGMFDYVDVQLPCICGTILSGWQSKDAGCDLATISPADVRRFYDICPDCNMWNEWQVIPTSWYYKRILPKPEKENK